MRVTQNCWPLLEAISCQITRCEFAPNAEERNACEFVSPYRGVSACVGMPVDCVRARV
jgi:hypothetical protein